MIFFILNIEILVDDNFRNTRSVKKFVFFVDSEMRIRRHYSFIIIIIVFRVLCPLCHSDYANAYYLSKHTNNIIPITI